MASLLVPEQAQSGRRPGKADAAIVLLLLVLAVFQIAAVQRLENVGGDSSVYMVLARNLLETGRYEFNYRPHTMYPPGFPVLLACVSMLAGRTSYDVLIRTMPAFSTLALVVWYFVLRRVAGRFAAGASCLLVATSAALFGMVTQFVLSDAPFFLISGLALWCLMCLEERKERRLSRFVLLISVSSATVAAVLVRSAGVALCASMLAWAATEVWRGGAARHAAARSAAFAALAGLVACIAWIWWSKHAEHLAYQGEHMQTYTSQFLTKDPHRPELGAASAGEMVSRAAANVPVQSSHITALLTRASYVTPRWYFPPTVMTVALLLAGLVSWAGDRWGRLLAWYFLAYFTVYLFWPFDEGPRFMLPVAPLAFVLMWRGLLAAARFLRSRPIATLATLSALAGLFAVATFTTNRLPGWQAQASLAFWPLAAVLSLLLVFLVRRAGHARVTGVLDSVAASLVPGRAHWGIVALLAAAGLFQQSGIARTNLAPDTSRFRHYPAVECSSWLRTAGDGVVMAQQYAIIHRLTGRRVESFPITGNPQIIVAAATRAKVRYLVVNDPVEAEYFFPTEEERWRRMERAYPQMFQMVHKGPGYRLFEVR